MTKAHKIACVTDHAVQDNKDHGANMGPTWVLSVPGGPHVGPMNLAIRGGTPMMWENHMASNTIVPQQLKCGYYLRPIICILLTLTQWGMGTLLSTWIDFNPSMDK